MNEEEIVKAWEEYSKEGWLYFDRPGMFDLFKAGYEAAIKKQEEEK